MHRFSQFFLQSQEYLGSKLSCNYISDCCYAIWPRGPWLEETKISIRCLRLSITITQYHVDCSIIEQHEQHLRLDFFHSWISGVTLYCVYQYLHEWLTKTNMKERLCWNFHVNKNGFLQIKDMKVSMAIWLPTPMRAPRPLQRIL